jgi:hypothetical protein
MLLPTANTPAQTHQILLASFAPIGVQFGRGMRVVQPKAGKAYPLSTLFWTVSLFCMLCTADGPAYRMQALRAIRLRLSARDLVEN